MKKLLLIALLSTFAMSEVTQSRLGKYTQICKSYIDEAKVFQATMGDDALSKQTFEFYKDKVRIHCGTLVAKPKFEKKSFIELMVKSEVKDKKSCKLAIDMASKYSKGPSQSSLMIAAHKENIADKCGSVMAAHVSNYCLHKEVR
ncbi:MAG: hypothetical protein L3J43_01675 [Sulfurovum sp.]|nr:hypothetical protein [Sulfurovum sp.]